MQCGYSDIVVSPQELKFLVDEGYQFIPPYQYISVEKATSDMTPIWDASTDKDWLTCHIVASTTPRTIQIGCKSIGMAAGIYHGQITITSHVQILPSPIVDITLEVKAKPEPVPPAPDPGPNPEPEPEPEPGPVPDPGPGPEPQPEPVLEPSKLRKIWELIKKVIDWILENILQQGRH